MKKIFLLLLASCYLLSSCSGDDAPASSIEQLTTNGTKLRKIIHKTSDGHISWDEFEYTGNKLNRIITSDGNYIQYYYTGDLITKVEKHTAGVLSTFYISYTTEGKLSDWVGYSEESGFRTEYIYNNDATVTINQYKGDLVSQDLFYMNYKAFLENNILVKLERNESVNGSLRILTSNYVYDNKHNPKAAILGFREFTGYEEGLYFIGANNLTQAVHTRSDSTTVTTQTEIFTYNSYGFPVTSQIGGVNSNLVTEYYYENP